MLPHLFTLLDPCGEILHHGEQLLIPAHSVLSDFRSVG